MNTTAIPIRRSTKVWEDVFGSEDGDAEYRKQVAQDSCDTESPASVRFERAVARFHRAVGSQRDIARANIVRKILSADDHPDEYIDVALQTFVSSVRPGRLDDAIDILSECGHLLPQFVQEVFSQHQAKGIDEDYWYCLIRALGKSNVADSRMYIDMLWSLSPEAAVEALGDIGDAQAIERLRAIAENDSSDFIREMAAEILEECSD